MSRSPRQERNAIRQGLDEARPVIVVAGHHTTPDMIDLLGPTGLDGVWLEGEHGSLAWDRIGDLSRACELWGMGAIARVSMLEPSLITRALSLGAHGVVVPHVDRPEECRRIVDAAKFAPLGRRGVARQRRAFGRSDFMNDENDETIVVVQLESVESLQQIEEMASVDGIDVLFVAPNDLAQSMGHQGEPTHPTVRAAIDDAIARVLRAGKVAGTTCAFQEISQTLAKGIRFLYTSYDPWLTDAASQFVRAVQSASGSETAEPDASDRA